MKTHTVVAALFTFVVLASSGENTFAADRHAQLLPDSTKLFLHSNNLGQLQENWEKTQYWRIYTDENVKEFRAEWTRYLETSRKKLEQQTGCTYDELQDLFTGEASFSTVATADDKLAYVIMGDVKHAADKANALLATAGGRLKARGAEVSSDTIHETEVAVFRLGAEEGDDQETTHFIRDDLLCITTNLEIAEGILARWGGDGDGSLSTLTAYQECNAVCDAEHKVKEPDLRVFADPIGYMRITNPPDPDGLEEQNSTELIIKHGGDALKGIGGTASLSADTHDVVLRAMIYAPKPYKGAMNMFSLPTTADFSRQKWLPGDVNMYATINWDLLKVIDNIGPVFDDMVGDGIEGTFDDLLADLKASDGPGVDLRADLLALLGPRITLINDSIEPIDESSERTLIAVEVKDGADEAKVALAVKKLLRDDPGVRRLRIPGQDNDLWQIGEDSDLFADQEGSRKLTSSAAMVAHRHILLASHTDLLRKLLRRTARQGELVEAADLKALDARLDRFIPGEAVGRIYSRTHQDFEVTYELLRQGKADELQSLYGSIISQLLKQMRDEESGELLLDFSTLPEFEAVRQYLGMIGIAGKNVEKGWYVIGIALPPAR